MLVEHLDWLDVDTKGGMSQQLAKLGLSYTQGQTHVPSPDPDFVEKREHIERVIEEVEAQPSQSVCVYLDEVTYYQRPSEARSWSEVGDQQSARGCAGSREKPNRRILAAMDHQTGQVWYCHAAKLGVGKISEFLERLGAVYPEGTTVYVVLDNAPVHFHTEVFELLEVQQWPWSFGVPDNWDDPNELADEPGPVSVQLTPLPTYASWMNPIEKLWRWLKQEVLHMHSLADGWKQLQKSVDQFLSQFTGGPSPELLEYTGLSGS